MILQLYLSFRNNYSFIFKIQSYLDMETNFKFYYYSIYPANIHKVYLVNINKDETTFWETLKNKTWKVLKSTKVITCKPTI